MWDKTEFKRGTMLVFMSMLIIFTCIVSGCSSSAATSTTPMTSNTQPTATSTFPATSQTTTTTATTSIRTTTIAIPTIPVFTGPIPTVTVTFSLIPHKPGEAAITPHPIDKEYEACSSCHSNPASGTKTQVGITHSCDLCHTPNIEWDHTQSIDTSCVLCHFLAN